MNRSAKLVRSRVVSFCVVARRKLRFLFSRCGPRKSGLWATHSHDASTAVSSVTSQPLSTIHWQVPVDLPPPTGEIFIDYGSPLITAPNRLIVPVKTGAEQRSG
jgi:hypothetical protein